MASSSIFSKGVYHLSIFFYCFVRGFLDIYFLFLKYKSLVWSKIHCFSFCLFCARLSNFYINTMYNSSFGFTSAISLNEKKKSFFSTLQPKHEVAAYVRIARPFYSSHLVIYTLTFFVINAKYKMIKLKPKFWSIILLCIGRSLIYLGVRIDISMICFFLLLKVTSLVIIPLLPLNIIMMR